MRTLLGLWSREATPTGDEALEGQTMVEYALILVLVAIACILSVSLLGDEVLSLWNDIDTLIRGTLAGR